MNIKDGRVVTSDAGEFEESKHPRESSGKFTSKGGGGGASKASEGKASEKKKPESKPTGSKYLSKEQVDSVLKGTKFTSKTKGLERYARKGPSSFEVSAVDKKIDLLKTAKDLGAKGDDAKTVAAIWLNCRLNTSSIPGFSNYTFYPAKAWRNAFIQKGEAKKSFEHIMKNKETFNRWKEAVQRLDKARGE